MRLGRFIQIMIESVTEEQVTELDQRLQRAGPRVDGYMIRDEIPNTSSIGSSFNDYEVLRGIRIVPMSAFDPQYIQGVLARGLDKRTQALAYEISENRELNPLIIAYDSEAHPYVLEGAHRFDALITLKAQNIPALVVIDLD